eukprot:CAMPEP_0185770908 /NCGR_PEP_ID=MMETSP1174-20130828/61795_1 /TAXON_ID=35687 /ORGANISM="Dictyocha speculum, Strain CCMP1381" /LENGTH=121 /DNA_ID=CAMNT_0028456541 /DNA_START=182 /DNA_END=544 /DNA_ORIENTATION=+
MSVCAKNEDGSKATARDFLQIESSVTLLRRRMSLTEDNGKKDSDSEVNQLKQQLRNAEIKNAGLTDRIEEITGTSDYQSFLDTRSSVSGHVPSMHSNSDFDVEDDIEESGDHVKVNAARSD